MALKSGRALDAIAPVTYNKRIMPRSAAATVLNKAPEGVVDTGLARRRLRLLPSGAAGNAGSETQAGRLITDSKQPLRVLIVDDEPAVAATLEEMIIDAGGEPVGVITSALAAIGAAAVITPDVVLMDVRLPGAMDGIEAAGIIRARRSSAVVMITGAVADPDIQSRLRTQDGFEVVFKPVREAELLDAIRRAYAAR